MTQLTLTSTSSSENCYIIDSVRTTQEAVPAAGNLTYSSSNDDLLTVFVNQDLVFRDTLSEFSSKVSCNFEVIVKVLTNAIKSLKLAQDYNGTYVAYLSGQLSDDEFLEEANKYSYSPLETLDFETLRDIRILFETTKIEFTPSEIAEIFKIEHNLSVDAIMKLNIPVVDK